MEFLIDFVYFQTMFNFKRSDDLLSASTPYVPTGKARQTLLKKDSPEVLNIFSESQDIR